MKRTLLMIALMLMLAPPARAAMEHDHGHQAHNMKMTKGISMHEMEIDGFRVKFQIMDREAFRSYMDDMGHKTHEMREGMTHYVMVDLADGEGKQISRAHVRLTVTDPAGKAEERVAFPMMGSFGAEFQLPSKGTCEVSTFFKVEGKEHQGGYSHKLK